VEQEQEVVEEERAEIVPHRMVTRMESRTVRFTVPSTTMIGTAIRNVKNKIRNMKRTGRIQDNYTAIICILN